MRGPAGSRMDQDLARIFGPGLMSDGDRVLLDRFHVQTDPAAFEELMVRHGPMVRGVCRRVLGNSADADDAFQATWLVLVRKAGKLRNADQLAPWLHGVASRVAIKARARQARRRERSHDPKQEVPAPAGPAVDLIDLPAILDAELERISAKLRTVLILCLLEGITAEEASVRLGCPVGTIKSRLARGRAVLRDRLVRRGVAPGVVAAGLTSTFTSPVSASIIRATLATITSLKGGIAPGIALLARGVAPAMSTKFITGTTLMLGGVLLAGVGMATWQTSPPGNRAPDNSQPGPIDQSPPADSPALKQSVLNLKKLGLAFLLYHHDNDYFPAAAILGGDGQSKLSWRVEILPYLEPSQKALYEEFHRDEPWDSPHNKALIPRMPEVFNFPWLPTPPGETRLRGFAGEQTMFSGTVGARLGDVIDGTSYTLMIVPSVKSVPWTQPQEVPYAPDKPLLFPTHGKPDEIPVLLADGSVRIVSLQDEALWRKLITRNGDEAFTWPNLPLEPKPNVHRGREPQAAANSAMQPLEPKPSSHRGREPQAADNSLMGPLEPKPSSHRGREPQAAANSTIEARLQRMEDKLDLLLNQFDTTPKGKD